MTQLNNELVGDPGLLERLREASLDDVTRGAAAAEGLTAEDEANRRRGTKQRTRHAVANIRIGFYYFLAIIVSAMVLTATAGAIWIVYKWIAGFINNPKDLSKFVTNALWTILVIMATLFAEGILKDKD